MVWHWSLGLGLGLGLGLRVMVGVVLLRVRVQVRVRTNDWRGIGEWAETSEWHFRKAPAVRVCWTGVWVR